MASGSPLAVVGRGDDPVVTASKRLGEVKDEIEQVGRALTKLFEEAEKQRAVLREEGMRIELTFSNPVIHSAYMRQVGEPFWNRP